MNKKEYHSTRITSGDKDFYMDGYLQENLDTAKRVIRQDWDFVFLVDGRERSGKSVLAQQAAKFCDPTFDINRIVFTHKEFREKVDAAEPYTAIVYDEAYNGLSSRETMGRVNKALVKKMATIGQKNLFIFVVMPTFFDLDKYVALWRGCALLHIYTGDDFERGYFAFWNYDKKKDLYIYGKKFYSYGCVKPNFYGRFLNDYTVDEKEYRKRKADAEKAHEEGLEEPEKELDEKKAMEWLKERLLTVDIKLRNEDKAKLLGVSEMTYYRWKQNNENNEEIVGIS